MTDTTQRKLDTSTGAGGATAVARVRFNSHLDDCPACQPHLCQAAEQLWRTVCLTALKQSAPVGFEAFRNGGTS
jgi:predicted anti-sigma-YlaC factor YlaD